MMLNKIFNLIAILFSKLQGKGWGSQTIEQEIDAAIKLLSNNKPELCVDIGGNKGAYSEKLISKYPNCTIVIFEPSTHNNEILRSKFKKNKNIIIEKSAVTNFEGNAALYNDIDGSGLASLTKRKLEHFNLELSNSENVKTITFEKYWKEKLGSKNIDICKLDIEGHEMHALSSFGDCLNHIDLIQFEFGGCNIDTRTFFQDFWYFFKERGFDLYRISPLGLIRILEYKELDEFFITTNYIAKRKL
jgi:FkbM family methyltransferase